MKNKQNTLEPLTLQDISQRTGDISKILSDVSQIIQNAAKIVAQVAAVGTLLTSQVSGLSSSSIPAIHPTHSATSIQAQIELETTKLNQLQESEDKETLSKAMEAISNLQEIIAEKTAELQQGEAQLVSIESSLKLSPEQLKVKAELENNLARLQDETVKLDEIKQRIEASQEAIDWLNPETDKKLFFRLAKDAGDTALNAHAELKKSWEATEVDHNTQQFYFDIKNFLSLIYTCLLVCRPNIIDKVLNEKQLPLAPLPPIAYVSAFEFIRDHKVPNVISGAAATEVTAYLNYLIQALSK